MLTWHLKPFEQLSVTQLYNCLKLRIDVFVVEQTCYYPDLDDKDRHPATLHLYATNEAFPNIAMAYARILAKGVSYDDYVSIGRVVSAPEARGTGIGHELMAQALKACDTHFPLQSVKISAQEHLESFYNKHGFIRASDMYLEDDIPHIAMILAK